MQMLMVEKENAQVPVKIINLKQAGSQFPYKKGRSEFYMPNWICCLRRIFKREPGKSIKYIHDGPSPALQLARWWIFPIIQVEWERKAKKSAFDLFSNSPSEITCRNITHSLHQDLWHQKCFSVLEHIIKIEPAIKQPLMWISLYELLLKMDSLLRNHFPLQISV